MKKNTLNVAYSFDDGYAQHAAVSITSLLENNKDIEGAVAMLDVSKERINNCIEEQKAISERVDQHREHIESIFIILGLA